MIFTKYDTSNNDEQVEKLTKKFSIHYRAWIGSLVNLLYTRVYLSFAVHKLGNFSANPGKVHFEGLIHILIYIRDNNTLGLNYYPDMNDAPVTDLLRQASIKTENRLMAFSDSCWQDCPDTVRSTRSYIIFYQGGKIDHGKHVTGSVAQPNVESEYNAGFTAGTALANFRMLIHELLNKYQDIVPEIAPMIVLVGKYAMYMADNGKNTKHTRHIARMIYFVSNG